MTEVVYPLSEGEAYGFTYGCLVVFAIVAGLAVPAVWGKLKQKDAAADPNVGAADFWYSARNSQGWISIALSIFASSCGAWMLFAAPEVGAINGWWGVIGYTVAITLAPFAMCMLGPMVRKQLGVGVTIVDWIRERYGAFTYYLIALIGVFYMWVYMVAELTSMGTLMASFSGLDPLNALIPVSVVTMLYTMVAGLPASIWTDRVQGVIVIIFIIVVCVACWTDLDINESRWKGVANFNDKGFEALASLCFAVFGAEIFNMSTWQRVYAAENERVMWKGFMVGTTAIGFCTCLFAICGMMAEAEVEGGVPIKALSFFQLLNGQPKFFQVLCYILATCMVASSVDSLQTGIVGTISKEIMRRKMSPLVETGLGAIFVALVNIPAIAFAAEATKDMELSLKILDLFMIADIVMIALPVPIFAGLWPFVTTKGCLCGIFSGFLTVLVWGWVEFGTFMAGLEMFTLMKFGNIQPPESGLYAWRTPIIFAIIPLITAFFTFTVSWMERMLEKLTLLTADGAKETVAVQEVDDNRPAAQATL